VGDARLRDLERAAAAGDTDAAARYIQERMRGGLPQERVELLAHCLHPPAYMALGWEPVETKFKREDFKRPGQEVIYTIYRDLESWPHCLRRWGREAAIRAGVAGARYRYPLWLARCQEFVDQGFLLPVKPELVMEVLRRIESTPEPYPELGADGRDLFSPVIERAFRDMVESTGVTPDARVLDPLIPFFVGRLATFCASEAYWELALALRTCGEFDAVLGAIRSELVPWVLGWERQKGRP
jgi:hypothetical protein